MLQNPELHYLDNAATTMVAPEVADVIDKAMREHWANPSSLYGPGARRKRLLNAARAAVARTLGCKQRRSLLYLLRQREQQSGRCWARCRPAPSARASWCPGFEHPSVQRPLERWQSRASTLSRFCPGPDGRIDTQKCWAEIDKNTVLVACMTVNNEIGAVQDVGALGQGIKRRNSRTHRPCGRRAGVDACAHQTGNIDTLSSAATRSTRPRASARCSSGTAGARRSSRPISAATRSAACAPAPKTCPTSWAWPRRPPEGQQQLSPAPPTLRALNQQLRAGLKAFPEVVINSPENAVPEVLNFSENCIKSETMLAIWHTRRSMFPRPGLPGIGQPSHTLQAMGCDPLAIDTAIRVSFCADNTPRMWTPSTALRTA